MDLKFSPDGLVLIAAILTSRNTYELLVFHQNRKDDNYSQIYKMFLFIFH